MYGPLQKEENFFVFLASLLGCTAKQHLYSVIVLQCLFIMYSFDAVAIGAVELHHMALSDNCTNWGKDYTFTIKCSVINALWGTNHIIIRVISIPRCHLTHH